MVTMKHLPVIILSLVLISSCSSLRFPGVHKITIQQGNVISQNMIDKLKPGMTQSQVRFVLGNPVVDDSLDQNRWDYIYSIQIGGGVPFERHLVVYFEDGRLSHFQGNFKPSEATSS